MGIIRREETVGEESGGKGKLKECDCRDVTGVEQMHTERPQGTTCGL